MSSRPTLLRPPPYDPNKSPIENVLEVTELGVFGPDVFTNTRQPWHPPGARGIYGGAVIAQCLEAAQRTVPSPGPNEAPFFIHSCHCYFLLAGSAYIPILYHVERVRDGRSFATRTVQARQRGRCIFTTTVSFVREGAGGKEQVRHATPLPEGVRAPLPSAPSPSSSSSSSSSAKGQAEGEASNSKDDDDDDDSEEEESMKMGPFQSRGIEIVDKDGRHISEGIREGTLAGREHELKCRMWSRARGRISEEGGLPAHLNALAYVSDSYFIGAISRVHRLWRFPFLPDDVAGMDPRRADKVHRLCDAEGLGAGPDEWNQRPNVGMIVSLDHSIYFHAPRSVKADEWMFSEIETPWAGDGRGLVLQRIFAADGTLLVTCVQEGVTRLQPVEDAGKSKL